MKKTITKKHKHHWQKIVAQDFCPDCNAARTLFEGKWLVISFSPKKAK